MHIVTMIMSSIIVLHAKDACHVVLARTLKLRIDVKFTDSQARSKSQPNFYQRLLRPPCWHGACPGAVRSRIWKGVSYAHVDTIDFYRWKVTVTMPSVYNMHRSLGVSSPGATILQLSNFPPQLAPSPFELHFPSPRSHFHHSIKPWLPTQRPLWCSCSCWPR
jgi:hypothetical protein